MLNLRAFIAAWPYEPENLCPDTGPVLVAASLPRAQTVCDAHTPEGLRGVRARSARTPDGAGRELAWFPATTAHGAGLLSMAEAGIPRPGTRVEPIEGES